MSSPKPTPLHVAVFLPSPGPPPIPCAQFLDTACADIFAILDKTYISFIEYLLPPGMLALAPDVRISYVGVGKAGDEIAFSTGLLARLTCGFEDESVAVGKVDVVMVPGPDPSLSWDPKALAWLKAQSENQGTDIISICSGIVICGEAGLLAGKKACGPRSMQGILAQRFEAQKVQWMGQEWRWVRDGNFWSSGGVTNGNDVVAAYCRQSGRFAPELVEACLDLAEVGDRTQRYDGGKVA